MDFSTHPLNNQLVSTGRSKYLPTGTTDNNCYDNDHLFEQLKDLVNPQFRAWYCKRFYKLGRDRVLQLASIARADGKQPARLFSKLLKES